MLYVADVVELQFELAERQPVEAGLSLQVQIVDPARNPLDDEPPEYEEPPSECDFAYQECTDDCEELGREGGFNCIDDCLQSRGCQ